jgi:hypothetical protein
MGCTASQIHKQFNSIVSYYKNIGFTEVPCSSVVNYSLNNIFRSTSLIRESDRQTVHVTLDSRLEDIDKSRYPVYTMNLNIDSSIHKETSNKLFYNVRKDYYTESLQELIIARSTSEKRFLDHRDGRTYTCHLDICKLSDKTISYLRSKVDAAINDSDRSNDYEIVDVYFYYVESYRQLVAVIKHSDHNCTEAIYLK